MLNLVTKHVKSLTSDVASMNLDNKRNVTVRIHFQPPRKESKQEDELEDQSI